MRQVTLNTEQRLYVIPCGDGVTCHGFDVVAKLTEKLEEWMDVPQVARNSASLIGTLEGYESYQRLCQLAESYCQVRNKQCPIELTPQLIGLEHKRVEVVDAHGETRRFVVGKSTGWMPCHLELKTRQSSDGPAVTGAPFKNVRVIK